jgi:hypothetical protein
MSFTGARIVGVYISVDGRPKPAVECDSTGLGIGEGCRAKARANVRLTLLMPGMGYYKSHFSGPARRRRREEQGKTRDLAGRDLDSVAYQDPDSVSQTRKVAPTNGDDMVWINPHHRISCTGKLVHVRGHWRRWPLRRSSSGIPLPHPPAA